MGTDFHELVNAGQATDGHPIGKVHMPTQGGVVRQGRVVVDLTVVGNMAVGHDPVLVSDARDTAGGLHAQVDGAELADGIAGTNDQFRGLTRVLLVLRHGANRVELEYGVVAPDRGAALNHAMGTDAGALCNANLGPDDGVRPHDDGVVQDGTGIHQRSGMNGRHVPAPQGIRRMVHISSASQAISSPTFARALNL